MIDRKNDFFGPYMVQADQCVTYVLEEQGTLFGMVTFVISDMYLDGKVRPVIFARDLRIAPHRDAIRGWTQHFIPIMDELFHHFGCKHLFAIINSADVRALNAFIRPRPSRRDLPTYHLYRRFNLISLHGRFPWTSPPLPHLKIVRADESMLDALSYYVSQKSKQRDLSTVWDQTSFLNKIDRFGSLSLGHFLVAKDLDDNIVGCVAPWSSYQIQEYFPIDYGLQAHNFRQFLKFGKILGWTRPIAKPIHRLDSPASFSFLYLNFLFADHHDILEALMWRAYDDAQPFEFLMYTQTRSELMYRRPPQWISAKWPFGLYYVQKPGTSLPTFIHPRNERPAEIDPFNV
jgi:hypothetical protein